MVYVIRNSLKYVSYQNRKVFRRDLRPYKNQAPTEEAALASLDAFKAAWGEKYPPAVGAWERNLDRIRIMFRFTPEIRRLIYTFDIHHQCHRGISSAVA